jgi:Zn-dependent M16 (insulinase) family peptidase
MIPPSKHLRSHPVPALRLEFQEYRHRATGARHLHLAADDPHNAFMVAFLTVPQDSTGVAHILEHTALCGSQRYPVRDPFFMMIRRSLNTFMNAFTSSDWTAYPFASQNKKDFNNLLDVYLDADVLPTAGRARFRPGRPPAGIRPTPTIPTRNWLFKGVVFNEMKGAMSSPVQRSAKRCNTGCSRPPPITTTAAATRRRFPTSPTNNSKPSTPATTTRRTPSF